MEPRFKMSYKVTEDNFRELQRYFMFQRSVKMILNIVLLVLFFINLTLSIISKELINFAWILVPLFYLFEYYIYRRRVSLGMKRNIEMKHDNLFTTYEFFENHLLFTSSNGTKAEVDLSNIKHFEQSKNLVLLISKANLAYWFPIDSFEIGNLEEFKRFLSHKGIRVKY
ncbi:MAG: hypothetical protein IJ331_05970 [Ruminococcus sp.]|nr:hypothetical protein [Ruminococcus sp.]